MFHNIFYLLNFKQNWLILFCEFFLLQQKSNRTISLSFKWSSINDVTLFVIFSYSLPLCLASMIVLFTPLYLAPQKWTPPSPLLRDLIYKSPLNNYIFDCCKPEILIPAFTPSHPSPRLFRINFPSQMLNFLLLINFPWQMLNFFIVVISNYFSIILLFANYWNNLILTFLFKIDPHSILFSAKSI